MYLFREIWQQQERQIPITRRERRRALRIERRRRKQERSQAFEKKILIQLTLLQYRPLVRRTLKGYNRIVCHGKGRVQKGLRSNIHWRGKIYDVAKQADEVWTLCKLRNDVDAVTRSPKETEDASDYPRWEPLVVVGIDVEDRTLMINNAVIPVDKQHLRCHLEALAEQQQMEHPMMIWTDSLGLEIIGGLTIIAVAFKVLNAVVIIEEIPSAWAEIVAGVLFTAGLLLDISVFVGGFIGGAGLGGLLCAMVSDQSSMIWIGAILGGLLVTLNFFVDITIAKGDALNHPIVLRKEEWLFPVLFGTSLSNAALVPFNMAIGAIKGVMVTLLILARLLPLMLGLGITGLLTRVVVRLLGGPPA